MAESDGIGERVLFFDTASSEGGNVRIVGSDEKVSSVDPFQYRRRTSKRLYERICTLPFDCERIKGGTGNSAYDLCSLEILDAIANRNGTELVRRGWKNAAHIDWEAIY